MAHTFHKTILLESKIDLNYFLKFFHELEQFISGRTWAKCNVKLDFSNVDKIYPNGIIPIINQVNTLRETGIAFELAEPQKHGVRNAMFRNGWLHQLDPSTSSPPHRKASTSGLRSFQSSDELDPLINEVLDICLKSDVLPKGILETIEWSISEVAGNILDHSERNGGLVQLVYHPLKKHLSFVVSDIGIGIPTSMRTHFKENLTDVALIEKALQRGITSKPGRNQGQGLAGVFSIAQQANGISTIISNKGKISINNGTIKRSRLPNSFQGTFIEVQIDAGVPIDSQKVIGREPTNYFELAFESPDADEYHVDISRFSATFGNRPTGLKIRNIILNILQEKTMHRLIIDMSHVRVISSSCADELFAILFNTLGKNTFNSRIEIKGANPFCAEVIANSINRRLAN